MNWIVLFTVLAVFQTFVRADGDVLILTDDTFDKAIESNQFIMVKFFAPWCGHCKSFAPEYEKAAKMAKEDGKPYVLAELDATEHKKVAEKVKIEGFPTVKFYVNGNPIDYDGERTTEAVLTFLDKKSNPPSIKLETKDEVSKVKDGKGLRCILGTKTDAVLNDYVETARASNDYTFYHTTPEVLKEVFSQVNEDNVVLLKDFDEGMLIFTEKITKESFESFLESNAIPLVSIPEQKLIEAIFKPGGKKGVFLFRKDSAESTKTLDEEFKKLAKEMKSAEYAFAYMDIKENWGQRIAEVFAIEEDSLPLFEVVEMSEDILRYRHTGELTIAAMKQFMNDQKEGKITRYLKSEPEPTDNNGPVYKLTGKTFNRDVIDNDNDVLVKFYAPWCGHCKKLAPIYKNLAESLSSYKKLKFMEIDSTKNDVEGQSIQGFPTLKFFPGKDKANIKTYEGDRSEGDLAKFIKESASYEIDIPELRAKDEGDKNKEDL